MVRFHSCDIRHVPSKTPTSLDMAYGQNSTYKELPIEAAVSKIRGSIS